MTNLIPRFNSPSVPNPSPGESKKNAVTSCSLLKSFHKITTTGFYWMQNSCVSKPSKVVCEMENKETPTSIAMVNEHEITAINIKI